jgi:hypothetical protein
MKCNKRIQELLELRLTDRMFWDRMDRKIVPD